MKRLSGYLVIIGALLASTWLAPISSAAEELSGQALEIAPPVLTLSVDPGQTINTEIKLRDVANGPLIVSGQVNDFVAAGEDGTPKILLDEEAEADNPYSLRRWVAPLPELRLEPGELQDLPVTINVPANASPGGYYGVVRFTARAPEVEGQGVSLSASLGTLILVQVKGDAKQSMEIEEFAVSKDDKIGKLFTAAPLDFIVRAKNTGNVHLQPTGQIIIKDTFGKTVAGVNVNLDKSNVLPSSIRRFEAPLDKSVIGKKMLFGRYTAELTMTYGADGKTMTEKISFWVIPYKLILGLVLALVIGFFVLRQMLRNYNRRIIAKATGKSTKSSRKRRK